MAAPTTKSLTYFNIDTRQGENLDYVEAAHGDDGPRAYALLLKLWRHIYSSDNGCWVQFGEMQKRLFLRNNPGFDLNFLHQVLETCFTPDVEIFEKGLYLSKSILTSHGIQKRWLKIVVEAKRKDIFIESDYLLLSLDEVDYIKNGTKKKQPSSNNLDSFNDNVGINGGPAIVNSGIIPESFQNNEGIIHELTPQSKVKESKVKESKVKQKVGMGATAQPSPENQEISGKRVSERKKREQPPLPDSFEEVEKQFTKVMGHRWGEGYIRGLSIKFFNHYKSNGWTQSKGKKIVDWHASVIVWVMNDLDGTYAPQRQKAPDKPSAGQKEKLTPSASPVAEIERPPITLEEIKKFIEDIYQGYLQDDVPEDSIPYSIYDHLLKAGLQPVDDEKRKEILELSQGNHKIAKRMAVIHFFRVQKSMGAELIFKM